MNAELPQKKLDYHPCHYGASKVRFRGPARRIAGDYIAFLGGTETFGRFIETPYPDLIEHTTGIKCINLGCENAGVDTYTSAPGLIDLCSMAKATVIQIMGAANMSNRFYTVDPRHNARFIRASRQFKEIYPEVDFSRYHTTNDMLTAVAEAGADRLQVLRHELQCAWVARMRTLLDRIHGPKILLWLSDHAPYSKTDGGTICRDPLFVDRGMISAVQGGADELIEYVAKPEEILAGKSRMVFGIQEADVADDVLGPFVHDRVAEALAMRLKPSTGPANPKVQTGDKKLGTLLLV